MVIKRNKVFFENLLIKKLTYDLPPNLLTVAEIFCLASDVLCGQESGESVCENVRCNGTHEHGWRRFDITFDIE